jgi:tetracycline repressor-like protein
MDPAVQRVVLLDAPVVLGWQEWRRIDSLYGLGILKHGLQALVDEGLMPRQPVEPLAHLLRGLRAPARS